MVHLHFSSPGTSTRAMGSVLSSSVAPPPDVDLLPPRFERRPRVIERLAVTPIDTLFGATRRAELLQQYIVPAGEAHLRARLHPDYQERTMLEVTAGGNPLTGEHANAAVTVGARNSELESILTAANVTLGTRGAATAVFSAFDTESGVGGFAHIPVELGSLPDAAAAPATTAAPPPIPPPLLPELGVRYVSTDLSAGVSASPFAPYPAKVWAVGAYSADGSREVTAGVQLSGALLPAFRKAAAATAAPPPAEQPREGGGDATFPGDVFSGGGGSGVRSSGGSLGGLADVRAAVSVAQPPSFEISLALDGCRRELVAGYIQSMTLRRTVRNPLESTHVKGIWNYVDVGLELRRSLVAPFASSLAVGAAWQANKNVLLKVRGGPEREVAGTLALRSWWDPSVTLALTGTVGPGLGVGLGAWCSIEKGGELQYRKAVAGTQAVGRNLNMRAQPHVGAAADPTGRLDPLPYAPPPGSRGSAAAAASAGDSDRQRRFRMMV